MLQDLLAQIEAEDAEKAAKDAGVKRKYQRRQPDMESQARQPGQDYGSRGREAQVQLLNNFLSTQFFCSRIKNRHPRNLSFKALC